MSEKYQTPQPHETDRKPNRLDFYHLGTLVSRSEALPIPSARYADERYSHQLFKWVKNEGDLLDALLEQYIPDITPEYLSEANIKYLKLLLATLIISMLNIKRTTLKMTVTP